MFSSASKRYILLITPFALLVSTALVFEFASQSLGSAAGYLLGFAFYWVFWCLLLPLLVLGWKDFTSLLAGRSPLFVWDNRIAAFLWLVVTAAALVMYGPEFIRAAPMLILVSIPLAAINGVCEELLWRGLYVRAFPQNSWLSVFFPAAGFAFWHLVPLRIFHEGNEWIFVTSTFFLGLVYGFIARKTGSAKWTAISHGLNGILALSGMLAPSLVKLLSQYAS